MNEELMKRLAVLVNAWENHVELTGYNAYGSGYEMGLEKAAYETRELFKAFGLTMNET